MSEYDGTDNPTTPWREDGTSENDNRGDDELTGRDRTEFEPNPNRRGTVISAVVSLVGCALLVEAALLELVASQFWNVVLVGATLVAAGGYNYVKRSNEEFGSLGVAALVVLLGLWLVASPFLLGTGTTVSIAEIAVGLDFWVEVIVGLLAVGLGGYSAYGIRVRRREATPRETAT
ncbi:hypothetical protein [Natrinema halophilum]|uniref:SPW repeat-containing protein n=1 Tax=Natrinema halophilum TaxID=1699371 RepID=A0A7D5KHZ4_9EURY|nr:hypothetical protein [Natrinema halophilum]QLG47999.1 hypothetical protein HYG82_03650 [Natrinema halophilum]